MPGRGTGVPPVIFVEPHGQDARVATNMWVAVDTVGRGSARAAARDVIKGHCDGTPRGSGGASPYPPPRATIA
jgi:hypothetical protein